MLARRPYSIAEMRQALEKKYPQSGQVPEAIARLRELGYLDDRKFAEQYAYSLAQNRAFGPHRLRRELKAKLVNYQEIEPAVERVYQETPAQALLEQALGQEAPHPSPAPHACPVPLALPKPDAPGIQRG